MRVLVLGGGGREHALCWALGRDPEVTEVLCAPGNAGIVEVARCHPIDPCDSAAVVELARAEAVDLVVVGPEAPLVAGAADALRAASHPVFGPSAAAAQIEGSKRFAKEVMTAAGVPTAGYWAGSDAAAARAALDAFAPPYVVKADGLAAGKGVRICDERAEAEAAIDDALVGGRFGAAGRTVVLEEFLVGPEVSVFAACDGVTAIVLGAAQDYKRAYDGDEGPNTGGMGAFSPVPAATSAFLEEVRGRIFEPVLAELARRGMSYVGVLYAGLVLTADGPQVLEFNARFGDPEAQVLLPRLEGPGLAALLAACAGLGERAPVAPPVSEQACVTVVLASGGYPGAYETGLPITGLEAAAAVPDAVVFHAGTARKDGEIVTAGGRVLAVSGLGATLAAARAAAYRAVDCISFPGRHRRADIAAGL